MASLIKVRNGVAKRNPRRRRKARRTKRNGAAKVVAKASNPRRRRRRASTMRNGATLRAVANPRRKRRSIRRRRNPSLLPTGSTGQTAAAVASLGAGMIVTKIGGGILAPFLQRFMSQIGAGSFTQVGSELIVALTVVNYGASKIVSAEKAKYALLGGLAVSALDALDLLLPDTLNLNPFSASAQPIVIAAAPAAAASPSVSGYAVPMY